MESLWKQAIWRQFGAAFDALAGTVEVCPDELWFEERDDGSCWYLVYHTLFWADLYLTGRCEGFAPPDPFGLEELDPAGVQPATACSRGQMLEYLRHCRSKCRDTIDSLERERAEELASFGWGTATFAELLIYNLRHVQHGAGQMNLVLRQHGLKTARWAAQALD